MLAKQATEMPLPTTAPKEQALRVQPGDEGHSQRRPGPGWLCPLCHGPRNPPPSGATGTCICTILSSRGAVKLSEWVLFAYDSLNINCLQLPIFLFTNNMPSCRLCSLTENPCGYSAGKTPHIHTLSQKTHLLTEKRPGGGLWKCLWSPR